MPPQQIKMRKPKLTKPEKRFPAVDSYHCAPQQRAQSRASRRNLGISEEPGVHAERYHKLLQASLRSSSIPGASPPTKLLSQSSVRRGETEAGGGGALAASDEYMCVSLSTTWNGRTISSRPDGVEIHFSAILISASINDCRQPPRYRELRGVHEMREDAVPYTSGLEFPLPTENTSSQKCLPGVGRVRQINVKKLS